MNFTKIQYVKSRMGNGSANCHNPVYAFCWAAITKVIEFTLPCLAFARIKFPSPAALPEFKQCRISYLRMIVNH